MECSEQTKPATRSYLAANADFASGRETPRQFLERSLELLDYWEPQIGAFVYHRFAGGARCCGSIE